MTRMGAPATLYKSHSLRKGGVTALLAAGVPLPQIQLMARWVSPNMVQLYASLTSHNLGLAFQSIGKQSRLDLVANETRFWQAHTESRGG